MESDDRVVHPGVPFDLDQSLILLGRRGSEAHGTYTPGSHGGVDDRDLMGIVIPPKDYYFGTKSWDVAEAINPPWDVVLYEIRKFVNLLCKQNPNVLQLLWIEEEDYLPVSEATQHLGRRLIENRLLFQHAGHAKNAFVGYAHGQLKRTTAFDAATMQWISGLEAKLQDLGVDLARAAEGKWDRQRSNEINILCEKYVGARRKYHRAYMGSKRWSMVQQFGYDPKNAGHMVRLLHLGYEYLTTGQMNVRRTWDRDMLIEIKTGQWTLEAIKAHADEWFKKVDEVVPVLPDSIDLDTVNDLVVGIIEESIYDPVIPHTRLKVAL